MTQLTHPRLRPVESFPVNSQNGEVLFALRDPEGFASSIVIPHAAAVLAALMDGERDLPEIQSEYHRRFGEQIDIADIEGLVHQLDDRCFLETNRFRARWKQEVEAYLNNQVRPAAHAGGAYAGEPEALTRQLDKLFLPPAGPGRPAPPKATATDDTSSDTSSTESSPGDQTIHPAKAHRTAAESRLAGVLSPHIDLHRGGPTFAWAYKRLVEESDADLFIVFGTAHSWLRNLFSISKKHFATPLGTVETDRHFIGKLAARLKATPGAGDLDLFASELAHRYEHSLEFQMVFLQYLLGGKRPFKVVPILTGSFHEFVATGKQPNESPQVRAFVEALRRTAAEHTGKICYISGGDLAHIGQRFGDRQLLDQARLQAQAESDLRLLDAACRADSGRFFQEVAQVKDQNRICGLSPTYTMLEVMRPERGELLKYDQAVEPDGTACVSFGSLAFYGSAAPAGKS